METYETFFDTDWPDSYARALGRFARVSGGKAAILARVVDPVVGGGYEVWYTPGSEIAETISVRMTPCNGIEARGPCLPTRLVEIVAVDGRDWAWAA